MKVGTKVEIGFFNYQSAIVELTLKAELVKIYRQNNESKAVFLLDSFDMFNTQEHMQQYFKSFKDSIDWAVEFVDSKNEKFVFDDKTESCYRIKKIGSDYLLTLEATDDDESTFFDEFNKYRTEKARAKAEARKLKARHKDTIKSAEKVEIFAL